MAGDVDWPARMLRGTPALLAYLDLQQRILFANHTYHTWLGVRPSELVGRLTIEVVGKRNYQSALPALQRAYAGRAASYEGTLFRETQTRYVHGNFSPDIDANGRVCGVFTALVDITERRTLELQLDESDQRFFGAFQHAAVLNSHGVAVLAINAHGRGRGPLTTMTVRPATTKRRLRCSAPTPGRRRTCRTRSGNRQTRHSGPWFGRRR